MNAAEIIARKRDGHTLRPEEIEFFLHGFAQGAVPDYQMAALAMAIFCRGMSLDETANLTEVMVRSGRQLQWPEELHPIGDKHSTGGIGDKVSLVLAPLLASAGVSVPMISGRGLGPTGGTLDKLEAIPGFRTDLSLHEFQACVAEVGCAIVSATSDLAPADRKLYALRDVTGTVPSIPLITASILSKKLAAGLDALVLDVKWGTGAFMKTHEEARHLADSLVQVGTRSGLRTRAVLSDMNQPLGRMVGHSVEVDESIETLQGKGPADLVDLTLLLGAELLLLLNRVESLEEGFRMLDQLLAAGQAWERFEWMVRRQGGDLISPRPRAAELMVTARQPGVLHSVDAQQIGQLMIDLGGGRRVKEDKIDHSVGLEMFVRLGEQVERDQPLARLFVHPRDAERAENDLRRALTFQP